MGGRQGVREGVSGKGWVAGREWKRVGART